MSKLNEMFEAGWYKELEEHLKSPSFRQVGQTLHDMAKRRIEIAPKFEDTFRAFKECPWGKLHTVILGQDPYPGKIDPKTYVADGIAFSSKNSKKIPKSLDYIMKAIDEDIFAGTNFDELPNFDLTRWANQGILLLNTALTFPINTDSKSGAHANLWNPFITTVLRTINSRKDSIAFGLMGSYAKAYRQLLTNESFAVYTCEHPAAALYNKKGKWDHEFIFKRIDSFHKFKNNIHIQW
jgi:uracil-DNA glycosylase